LHGDRRPGSQFEVELRAGGAGPTVGHVARRAVGAGRAGTTDLRGESEQETAAAALQHDERPTRRRNGQRRRRRRS